MKSEFFCSAPKACDAEVFNNRDETPFEIILILEAVYIGLLVVRGVEVSALSLVEEEVTLIIFWACSKAHTNNG